MNNGNTPLFLKTSGTTLFLNNSGTTPFAKKESEMLIKVLFIEKFSSFVSNSVRLEKRLKNSKSSSGPILSIRPQREKGNKLMSHIHTRLVS